jgi:hypothetical protein
MNDRALEQQNILLLFNTKDPVNMEMAETIAISTGNGQWFNEYIDAFAENLSKILEKYTQYLSINHTIWEGFVNIGHALDLENKYKTVAYALILFKARWWTDWDMTHVCNISILETNLEKLRIIFHFKNSSLSDELKKYNVSFEYYE